jgi:hypothetical protein
MELDLLSVQSNESSSVIGSTLTKINEYGVVIGGFTTHSPSNCNLIIRFFHFPSLQWKSVIVSTNNHSNRYYHSSSLLGNKIYVFGGYNLPQNTLSSSILSISESRFGWKVNKVDITSNDTTDENGINPSSLISLVGLSSNVVGKTNEKIIVFGGTSLNNQQYFNEVTMFSFPSANSPAELKVIPIDGVKPEARAFHTSSVIGSNRCHLMVTGGQTENQQLLNDMWILDLNEIVNVDQNAAAIAAAEAANAKGGKGKGKEAVVRPPSAIWTKLSIDNLPFIPRCFHSTVLSSSNVFVFGGMSKKGPLPLREMTSFSIEESNGKFNLLTDSVKEINVPVTTGNNSKIINEETVFGCSSFLVSSSDLSLTTSSDKEEVQPVGIMIFGGSRSLIDSKRSNWSQIYNITYFLSLQEKENPFMKTLKEKVKTSNSHISEISFQSTMKGKDSMKFLTRISYENNDIYIGEVHRNAQEVEEGKDDFPNISEDNGEQLLIGNPNTDTPNGFGKIFYSNGDVYEVRLLFLLYTTALIFLAFLSLFFV